LENLNVLLYTEFAAELLNSELMQNRLIVGILNTKDVKFSLTCIPGSISQHTFKIQFEEKMEMARFYGTRTRHALHDVALRQPLNNVDALMANKSL